MPQLRVAKLVVGDEVLQVMSDYPRALGMVPDPVQKSSDLPTERGQHSNGLSRLQMRVQEGDGFSIQTDAEFYRPLCGILKKLKVTGLGYTFPPKVALFLSAAKSVRSQT